MKPPGANLHCLLNSIAWKLLHQIRTPITADITGSADRADGGVIVRVYPVNQPGLPPLNTPGTWLSPIEQLIWNALAGPEPLVGKEIAAKIGLPHDPRIKYLLKNLEDRGVLTHEDGQGYSRGGLDTK